MRIDRKCLLITFQRLIKPPGVRVTMSQTRPGAEMTRHQFDRFFTIGDRLFAMIQQIMRDRALVVCFSELRIQRDGAGEMIDRLDHFAAIHGLRAPAQLLVGLSASAAEPDGPQSVLSHFIHDRIRVFQLLGKRSKTTCAPDKT